MRLMGRLKMHAKPPANRSEIIARMSTNHGDGAFSGLQEGSLVLADISGYSKFVAQTEVDHSWSILHELLETMVHTLSGRMHVSQVEGDAILFITGLTMLDVVRSVEETFIAFHRRLRDMRSVTTCPCAACANIGALKLKFVVHHGKFSQQRFGTIEQLHGTDVIIAHRLLKNTVPSKEYLLVTSVVLAQLPEEIRAGFVLHTEEFDLGVIACGYRELAPIWEDAQASERKRVTEDEAMLKSAVTVNAPIELVRALWLKPDVMTQYMMADGVDGIAGARGEDLGAEFHCHHGENVSSMRVVSLEPDEFTFSYDQPPGYLTTRLADLGGGRTLIERFLLWERPPNPELDSSIREMFMAAGRAGEPALREAFESRARAQTTSGTR